MHKGLRPAATITLTVCLLIIAALPVSAATGFALGPRGGYDFDSDHIVLGAEAEFGQVLQVFRFAPSIDLEPGDHTPVTLNSDFRLYLFNLPESGLRFYGSAGPTLLIDSHDKGGNDTGIGLSLVAGVKIPMKGVNRYNVETRFGIGDIPDFKLMLTVLFGI